MARTKKTQPATQQPMSLPKGAKGLLITLPPSVSKDTSKVIVDGLTKAASMNKMHLNINYMLGKLRRVYIPISNIDKVYSTTNWVAKHIATATFRVC